MRLKLLEADGFDDEILDDEEELIEPETELDQNEMTRRKISFPLLFEASYDDSGKPASISRDDREQIAQQYADAVTKEIEDNTKFIISTLDVYDFECYYDKMDANSFVTFIVTVDSSVSSDLIVNVLKRYFNLQIDDTQIEQDGENITVICSAILDNKYVRII